MLFDLSPIPFPLQTNFTKKNKSNKQTITCKYYHKNKPDMHTKFQVNVPGTPTFQGEWESGPGILALQVCIFIILVLRKLIKNY